MRFWGIFTPGLGIFGLEMEFFGHFGPFSAILDHFRPFLEIFGHFGPKMCLLDPKMDVSEPNPALSGAKITIFA